MATPQKSLRTAAVLGASGAVGGEIVRSLLARDWDSVVLLNRRRIEAFEGDPRVKEYVVDMSNSDSISGRCARILREDNDVHALFVAMGVGAASKVDEATLRKADVDLPGSCVEGFAKAVANPSSHKDFGVSQAETESTSVSSSSAPISSNRHVSLLTAVGADSGAVPATHDWGGLVPRTHAGGGLYNQVKGQVEDRIRETLTTPGGSTIFSLSIFRPATLIGTPHTPRILSAIAPYMDFVLPAVYKSSRVDALAAAMVADAERRLGNPELPTGSTSTVFEGTALQALYTQE